MRAAEEDGGVGNAQSDPGATTSSQEIALLCVHNLLPNLLLYAVYSYHFCQQVKVFFKNILLTKVAVTRVFIGLG
jgi:hypothetical protein